jgi:hypothetical protein
MLENVAKTNVMGQLQHFVAFLQHLLTQLGNFFQNGVAPLPLNPLARQILSPVSAIVSKVCSFCTHFAGY